MENNKGIVFVLCVLIGLIVFSCTAKQSHNFNTSAQKSSNVADSIIFEPDSTINNLILDNSNSSKIFYPDIDRIRKIDLIRKSPVKIFCNKGETEYLMAYHYEGSAENAFDCFEIGYINGNKQIKSVAIKMDNIASFNTENDLKLGMALDDLIKIKGNNFNKKNSIIRYEVNNHSQSTFLKKYNMPGYFLECAISNSKIVKITFGFEYP